MPYIDKQSREYWDSKIEEIVKYFHSDIDPGKINYILTKIMLRYIHDRGKRYSTYNEAIGIIECVKHELYRRSIAEYEEEKCKNNGDVFK